MSVLKAGQRFLAPYQLSDILTATDIQEFGVIGEGTGLGFYVCMYRAFIGIIRCRIDLTISIRPCHLAHYSALCCRPHCNHHQL